MVLQTNMYAIDGEQCLIGQNDDRPVKREDSMGLQVGLPNPYYFHNLFSIIVAVLATISVSLSFLSFLENSLFIRTP